jgi:FAD/FMN-containing dehydrogenase
MKSYLSRRNFMKQAGVSTCLHYSLNHAEGYASDSPPIDISQFTALKKHLRGHLILPSDSEYEVASRVFYWNPTIASAPVAVVRCEHEDDVVRAVDFARSHKMEVAVRSGGHSHLAWGSCNGLVIDVSPLKRIEIDPKNRIVRAQAGALSGEVARAAGRYGLAPVLGQCRGVSAAGVTLGGGLSWLSGLHGASCDNLLSANLVTADAKITQVNDQTDSELLWGLRGAGANFGVTTSFEAKVHEIGTVLGGEVHFAVKDAKAVLHGFREIMNAAPDSFQATLNLTPSERGVFISLCHTGPEQDADRLLQKIRSIASPIKEAVERQSFAALAERAPATDSGSGPPPAFRAIQTVYRDRLTDELIDIYVDQLLNATSDVVMGLSHYMHGQVCRVDSAATAFPHRKEHSVHLRVAYSWSDTKITKERLAWGEQWREALRPDTDEGIYANYQTYETPAGSPSIFLKNHARLLALKQKHDPENFFHRNANITPAKNT